MRRTDTLEKTLMLGKIEGRRKRGQHRMRWLDGIINSMVDGIINSMVDGITKSMDMSLSKFREMLKDREAWSVSVHGVTMSQT